MHTTKWSFEVPIPHLRDFHEDQDFVFALQHLCKDGEYRRYLQTCDKFIILDNSSNEKVQPCSVQELVTTAIDMQAGLIIAPDCDEWSVDATVEKWLETQRLASAVQVTSSACSELVRRRRLLNVRGVSSSPFRMSIASHSHSAYRTAAYTSSG